MKHILLLGTGGTIACKCGDSGLTPLLTGDELLSYVPDARTFCEYRQHQHPSEALADDRQGSRG